jgi:hypothetical protein
VLARHPAGCASPGPVPSRAGPARWPTLVGWLGRFEIQLAIRGEFAVTAPTYSAVPLYYQQPAPNAIKKNNQHQTESLPYTEHLVSFLQFFINFIYSMIFAWAGGATKLIVLCRVLHVYTASLSVMTSAVRDLRS